MQNIQLTEQFSLPISAVKNASKCVYNCI